MLLELLNRVSSQIRNLDIKENTPAMLAQICQARPDFREYLYENGPNRAAADLLANAVAAAAIAQIKGIPELVKVLVAQIENWSLDASLRCSVASILVYLVQPRDLIPDDAPGGYGFLDDNAILRAGFIEYMSFEPEAAKEIQAERERIQFTSRLVPLQVVQPLQVAINSMAMAVQLLRMLDSFTLELVFQQAIANPLQWSQPQQPTGFVPTPGPSLGPGHWAGGAYFEGGNVMITGGPALIDGKLFIPD